MSSASSGIPHFVIFTANKCHYHQHPRQLFSHRCWLSLRCSLPFHRTCWWPQMGSLVFGGLLMWITEDHPNLCKMNHQHCSMTSLLQHCSMTSLLQCHTAAWHLCYNVTLQHDITVTMSHCSMTSLLQCHTAAWHHCYNVCNPSKINGKHSMVSEQ